MAGDWGESGEGGGDALTRAIIDAIIKVHKVLGPGFGEAIYRRALVVELKVNIAWTCLSKALSSLR
jgi:hypothetical protein